MSGILQGGAGILSAIGSVKAGQAQEAAYKTNAELQQKEGEIARGQSFSSAEQLWQKVQKTLGAQRAAYGAAGIDPNTATPLEVMSETARQGELARHATLFQGLAQQQTADTQAAIDRFTGAQARKAGVIQAGTTLLTTGAKIANQGGGTSVIPEF
jgi:hypothetical protein